MESVLSDTMGAKLECFQNAKRAGYYLLFIHVVIADTQMSVARVIQRVREGGGHDVPAAKLIERFPRTRANAAKALALADLGMVFDNSSPEIPYQLTELWEKGQRT